MDGTKSPDVNRVSQETREGAGPEIAGVAGAVQPADPMRKSSGLVAYGLVFTGLFLMILSVLADQSWHWPAVVTDFVKELGLLLSVVMAGTIIHERLLREEMVRIIARELDERLRAWIPDAHDSARLTAPKAHRLFSEKPPQMTGIKLLHDVRRNYRGYYDWVVEQQPQDLFFAGRSVLHRINADIRARTQSKAEEILFRRLKEGSKIKILFLDPRIDIIKRLADEEGQPQEEMLGDIATSIGICQRLYGLLQQDYINLSPGSELTIRLYDRAPYFAYHRQDDRVIVGFYFFSDKGSSSAAYEIVDDQTKRVFEAHFDRILGEANHSTLVDFDGARRRPRFNERLFSDLKDHLSKQLGTDQAAQLMSPDL